MCLGETYFLVAQQSISSHCDSKMEGPNSRFPTSQYTREEGGRGEHHTLASIPDSCWYKGHLSTWRGGQPDRASGHIPLHPSHQDSYRFRHTPSAEVYKSHSHTWRTETQDRRGCPYRSPFARPHPQRSPWRPRHRGSLWRYTYHCHTWERGKERGSK